MSRSLLRIALCLCLLLQGMAPAFSALRMHAPATDGPTADAHHTQAPDCHGDAAAAAAPPPAAPTPDDCLQHCLDLCLQQGHALGRQAISMAAPGPHRAPLAPSPAPPPSARPFPPLRPPIV